MVLININWEFIQIYSSFKNQAWALTCFLATSGNKY